MSVFQDLPTNFQNKCEFYQWLGICTCKILRRGGGREPCDEYCWKRMQYFGAGNRNGNRRTSNHFGSTKAEKMTPQHETSNDQNCRPHQRKITTQHERCTTINCGRINSHPKHRWILLVGVGARMS